MIERERRKKKEHVNGPPQQQGRYSTERKIRNQISDIRSGSIIQPASHYAPEERTYIYIIAGE